MVILLISFLAVNDEDTTTLLYSVARGKSICQPFGWLVGWFVCWLFLTSYRQRGHLETVPPFTVPFGGREAWFLHRPHRESNTGSLRGSSLHNRCATPAPLNPSAVLRTTELSSVKLTLNISKSEFGCATVTF